MSGPLTRVLKGLVRGYQLVVSPWFAPTCRYYPSCSSYALDSLDVHGAGKGAVLAGWRLLRCNPWSEGGIDPVAQSGLSLRQALSQARGRSTIESSDAREPASTDETNGLERADETRVNAHPSRRATHGNL